MKSEDIAPASPVEYADPPAAAKAAGLRYVNDNKPGIRREPDAEGFRYVDAKGEPVDDEDTLKRIRSLAIPP
ncbi:MAG: DNA topoisomerase IB, partial [Ramlibacter sp.]